MSPQSHPLALQTYIALLYSIGIGDGGRLIMADWRAMMEDLGLSSPRTLIATGNAIFQCAGPSIPEIEHQMEKAFEKRFGRRVDTIVRAASSFKRLVRENPFPKESRHDGTRTVVRVMRSPIKQDILAALEPYATQGERVRMVGGDLWVHFKEDPNRSSLLRVLASKRSGIGTMRNWNTVRRLGEMLDNAP